MLRQRNQVAAVRDEELGHAMLLRHQREHAGAGRQPVGRGCRRIRRRHPRHDLVTGNAGRQRIGVGTTAEHGAQIAAADGDQLRFQLDLSRGRFRSRRGDHLHLPGGDDAGGANGDARFGVGEPARPPLRIHASSSVTIQPGWPT